MNKPVLPTSSAPKPAFSPGNPIEDVIGRVLQLLWFLTATWRQVSNIITSWGQPHWTAEWVVNFTHSSLLVVLSGLTVVMTVVRRPTKAVATGLEPRITSIAGTFLMLALPFLPGTDKNLNLSFVGLPILLIGLVLAIWCLSWLGRSYAIMAAARELVTGGPYSIVRHPLYASEMVIIVGAVLSAFSLTAVILGLVVFALQLRRTYNEERVLRAAFPEYDEYAKRVPRIIPRLSMLTRRIRAPEA